MESYAFEVTNKVRLLNLCKNLFSNSSRTSEMKLNRYLKKESSSEMVFMMNINQLDEEAVIQVVDETPLHNAIRIPLPEDVLYSLVIIENGAIMCPEYLDNILVTVINSVVANMHKARVVTVPVSYDESGNNNNNNRLCIGTQTCPKYLVCYVNSNKDTLFLIKLASECFRCTWNILSSTVKLEREAHSRRGTQIVLQATRHLLSNIRNFNSYLECVVGETKKYLKAERCLVYLVDQPHSKLVLKAIDSTVFKEPVVRFGKFTGDLGQVVLTGQVLTVMKRPETYLVDKETDELFKLYVEHVLLFPIRSYGSITGVIQACNKLKNARFDFNDELLANGLGFCYGLALEQCNDYLEALRADAKRKATRDLVVRVPETRKEHVADLMFCPAIHDHPDFEKLDFSPREIIAKETPCFVIKMLDNLGLPREFKMRRYTLAKFVFCLQHAHSAHNPYHNWTHAFCTAHFAYVTMRSLNFIEARILNKLECLAYFVSCLVHDLGHPGVYYNPKLPDTPEGLTLANLYTSEESLLKNYNLLCALTVLNETDCNIGESFPEELYKTFLLLLRDFIAATDLGEHFALRHEQGCLAKQGYKSADPKHKFLLANLLMTCADFSDWVRPFPTLMRSARELYEELLYKSAKRGIRETVKGLLGSVDRSRKAGEVPQMQIDFGGAVCVPCFAILAKLFAWFFVAVANLKRNLECWERAKPHFAACARGNFDALYALSSCEVLDKILGIPGTV